MGRFTHPEDLFPNLRHAFEAALHGQVAASDNDAGHRATHRGEHEVREIVESLPRFDLGQDADIGAAKAVQVRVKRFFDCFVQRYRPRIPGFTAFIGSLGLRFDE